MDPMMDPTTNQSINQSTKHVAQILLALCIALITVLAFLGGVYYYQSGWSARQLEKVQRKCKEYTDLACTFQPSGNSNQSQIVRGTEVLPKELPHQVFVSFIHIFTSLPGQCGGTLINEKFVLTATICVQNTRLDLIKVKLGSPNLDLGVWKKVRKVHRYEEHKSRSHIESSICLLELEENVIFSSDVRPICLNTKFENNYGPMFVSGWGLTENFNFSKILKKTELRSHNEVDELCRKTFGDNKYKIFNEKGICLAHRETGALRGDYGGPLQVNLKSNCSNTWEQIGVLSGFGVDYFIDGMLNLQLFFKVEYYVEWIASVAWPNG